jgi:choline dehydrogenase-like flavoprotein
MHDGMPADDATIECDVCIIGAGPAGLSIASTLAGGDRDVVLIESGGDAAAPDVDALNDGEVFGDSYASLRETRHRQVGGTAAIWNTRTPQGTGAKFTPLSPVDFEAREAVAHSGWPIPFREVRSWYERAQSACGLGAFAYDAMSWRCDDREPLAEPDPAVVSGVYALGTRDAFLTPMLRAVRTSSNVRVLTRATVVQLEADTAEGRIVRARVASRGRTWWVAARDFVSCGGAVENARLLLCSGHSGEGLGNRQGWVGRCFMEHPRDRSAVLQPVGADTYRRLRFYDEFDRDGAMVCGRFALADEAIRQTGLLNASMTLLPIVRPAIRLMRRAVGPLARHPAAERWLPRGGHGWSTCPVPRAALEGFRVLLNLEQAPDPENRVVLARRRDVHGVPRAELHWRWRARDEASRQRVRGVFSAALREAGLGVVRQRDGALDPNAHHHAGTTRMSEDERHGVVDAHCRVHGMENLHVAGASVFPTAGFANPVLTIVALALRLAERLRRNG